MTEEVPAAVAPGPGSFSDFEEIVEFLPDPTFVIDEAGRVIAWNRGLEKMTGVREEEIRGRGDREYAIPFYGYRRPLLLDLILSQDAETELLYDWVRREGDTLFAEVFIPSLYLGQGAHVWVKASPIRDTGGRVVGAIETIRDITQRKMAEDALRASEARYRCVVEDQTELICRFSPDGTFLFVNDAYCRYFGVRKAEIIGRRFSPVIPEEDRPVVTQALASLSMENPVATTVHRIIMPGGSVRWQQWSDRAIFKGCRTPVEYQSVGRDITEEKRAVEALRASEEKYRVLADMSPGMIYVVDRDGCVKFANRAAAGRFGREPAELVGKHLSEIFPPATAEKHLKAVGGVISSGTLFHGEFVEEFPTGECWIDARLSPIRDHEGTITGVMGISFDITRRKMADQVLRDSEERYHALFTRMITAFAQLDQVDGAGEEPDFRVVQVNPAFEIITGIAGESITGRLLSELGPAFTPETLGAFREVAGTGITRTFEYRIPTTGQIISGVIYATEKGRIAVNFQDITGRKRSEEQLRMSEAMYRAVFEHTGTMSIIFNEDMTIVAANSELEGLTGYSRSDVVGKKRWTDFVHPEDQERMIRYHVLRRKDPDQVPRKYGFRLITREGKAIPCQIIVGMIPGTTQSIVSITGLPHPKEE
jgi:PAS domain S-box-containing protein